MSLHLRTSSLLPPRSSFLHRHLPPIPFPRHASHAAQGRANKAAPGPGKRLGAKKSSQQYVVPGNIIFRQRGTHWFAGENCGMGRDHTIFAREKGYVVFYKDPEQLSLGVGAPGYGGGGGGAGQQTRGKRKVREKRRYIGVVMERGQTLPRARGAPRRRRLGLEVREMSTLAGGPEQEQVSDAVPQVQGEGAPVLRDTTKEARNQVPQQQNKGRKLEIRPGYMYREANWQIGRAERKDGKKVRVYRRGDRFLAWRKKKARLALAAEKRTLRGRGKKKTGGR